MRHQIFAYMSFKKIPGILIFFQKNNDDTLMVFLSAQKTH